VAEKWEGGRRVQQRWGQVVADRKPERRALPKPGDEVDGGGRRTDPKLGDSDPVQTAKLGPSEGKLGLQRDSQGRVDLAEDVDDGAD
jgi:hypothetical protein